jgi:hypothetical protein
VHSIIDFDLSLSSIMIILWVSFHYTLQISNIEKELVNKKNIYIKLKVLVIIMCTYIYNLVSNKTVFCTEICS